MNLFSLHITGTVRQSSRCSSRVYVDDMHVSKMTYCAGGAPVEGRPAPALSVAGLLQAHTNSVICVLYKPYECIYVCMTINRFQWQASFKRIQTGSFACRKNHKYVCMHIKAENNVARPVQRQSNASKQESTEPSSCQVSTHILFFHSHTYTHDKKVQHRQVVRYPQTFCSFTHTHTHT